MSVLFKREWPGRRPLASMQSKQANISALQIVQIKITERMEKTQVFVKKMSFE